jgi:hypothetical protein
MNGSRLLPQVRRVSAGRARVDELKKCHHRYCLEPGKEVYLILLRTISDEYVTAPRLAGGTMVGRVPDAVA